MPLNSLLVIQVEPGGDHGCWAIEKKEYSIYLLLFWGRLLLVHSGTFRGGCRQQIHDRDVLGLCEERRVIVLNDYVEGPVQKISAQ